MIDDKTEKYLRKYGIPSSPVEAGINECRNAVVVPAIAESDNLRKFLRSFIRLDKKYFNDTLLLFVINNSVSSPGDVKKDNEESLDFLRKIIRGERDEFTTEIINSGLNTGVIDASTPRNAFSDKTAGVGLARKTGMDAVLPMLKGKGILICTDADCTFPANYLTEVVDAFLNGETQAAVINFKHNLDNDETADAVINYEIFLRYYVQGLKYSNSPYAFHTIGSSMACSRDAYIKIEGMNKRKAAEDFYFLEKLTKHYNIKKITSTTVFPSSRRSWRVPFGTGQRMNRFLEEARDEYLLYHPACFEVMRIWNGVFFNNTVLSSAEYMNEAVRTDRGLMDFLKSEGFEKDWVSIINNCSDEDHIRKQKLRWFDGFRTLKLVHFLRDYRFGMMPMFRALDGLFKMNNIASEIFTDQLIPPRDIQLKYLAKLREADEVEI